MTSSPGGATDRVTSPSPPAAQMHSRPFPHTTASSVRLPYLLYPCHRLQAPAWENPARLSQTPLCIQLAANPHKVQAPQKGTEEGGGSVCEGKRNSRMETNPTVLFCVLLRIFSPLLCSSTKALFCEKGKGATLTLSAEFSQEGDPLPTSPFIYLI